MQKSILGRKIGMSQVFDEEGKAVPVTVIEAGPCYVVQKKTMERDGYTALQVGFEEVRREKLNSPLRGHFKKNNVKPLRLLKEIRLEESELDGYTVGQEIKVDIFSPGDCVDIQGISKGKGFTGAIKRHGFHRGPMSHGSKIPQRPRFFRGERASPGF